MAEPVAPAAPDMAQGYCVKLSALADGTYAVSGPTPYAEGEDAGESFTTIGEALKGIIGIVKENPVSGDDQKQFEAGYGAR